MTSPQIEQKMIDLFIKLSEATGFINDSTTHQVTKTKNELQHIVKKYQMDSDLAKMLWQIVQKSPVVYKQQENFQKISVHKLDKNIQKQILFAEYLVQNSKVNLSEINMALGECQKKPDVTIGQILLKKKLISSGEFMQINQRVLDSDMENTILRCISLKQHEDKIFLNAHNLPQNIGDYEIIREIARGGMGIVYQAKSLVTNKQVALKTIRSGSGNSIDVERFQREAKLTANLNHSNIVKIHEINLQGDIHYYTMDYIDGVSLSEYVRTHTPPLRKLLKIFVQIAEALYHAHTKNITHRDIKPSNILIDSNEKPFLTDFGLAKQEGKDGLTISGVAIGTPAYMPPEQAEGRVREIDYRSDIYSLGAVLYECLCGQPPFSGDSLAAILHLVINKEPVPPRQLNINIPEKIETICLKCLKKSPNQRYYNVRSFIRDMERFLAGNDIKAKKIPLAERFHKWILEQKGIVYSVLGTIVFMCVLFLGIHFLWNQNRDFSPDSADKIKDLQYKFSTINEEKEVLEQKVLNLKSRISNQQENFTLISNDNLAVLYGDYSEAVKNQNSLKSLFLVSEAIKLKPTSASLHLNRGIIFSKLEKQYIAAIKDFTFIIDKLQAQDGEKVKAFRERSYCHMMMKNYQEAMNDINYCIQKEPNIPDYYSEKAWIYALLNSRVNAETNINQAISMLRSVNFMRQRGEIYYLFGDYKKAVQDFQNCIEMNPNLTAEIEILIQQIKEKWLGKPLPQKFHKDLKKAIHYYYNNEGNWAEKYKIAHIEKIRPDNTLNVHVRYKYIPVNANSIYNVTGFDQRVFVVQKNNRGYCVLKMGANNSATFPE